MSSTPRDQVVDNLDQDDRPPPTRKYAMRFPQPSLTKQSMVDECNINNIMARFQKTGVIDHVSKHQPNYGVVSHANFTESQMLVSDAKQMFAELPSKARRHFHDDPGEFLAYVDDNPDLDLMYDLGLTEKPQKHRPGTEGPKASSDAKPPETAPAAPVKPPETKSEETPS